MILIIIEVVLFFSGLWTLVTGKLPAIVLGTKYSIEGMGARIVGLLIALPLPVAFMTGLVLAVVLGPEKGSALGTLIELVTLVVTLIGARVLSHHFHKVALNAGLAQQ
ncbi:MAG: hypothetical protein KJ077_49070 [Anaerolineae bacterium]|nr:hypothetical protein [Anaerolineae bacterium]